MSSNVPHSDEAEAAVIGAVMLSGDAIDDVARTLRSPQDFFQQRHGAIFDAVHDAYRRDARMDMVIAHQAVVDRGILEQVGGFEYLTGLAEATPNVSSAEYYARIVRDKAIMRDVISASHETLSQISDSGDLDLDVALDDIEQRFYAIREGAASLNATTETLAQTVQRKYDELTSGEADARGISTGLIELDELTNGLHPGQMVVIAARPGMGKSALMTNMVEHIILHQRKPCAVFSLEMSRDELSMRMMCSVGGVSFFHARKRHLDADEAQRLAGAVGELTTAPGFIDDRGGITITQLRARARRFVSKHDVAVVFVDYLQLMDGGGKKNSRREEEVAAISRGIKSLAKELGVPVVCLSQLNRNVESRESNKPKLSDLRESGSIEQDADVVMLLHRDDYYNRTKDNFSATNIAELDVAKQRNGPPGIIKLHWNPDLMRFDNLDLQGVKGRSGGIRYCAGGGDV